VRRNRRSEGIVKTRPPKVGQSLKKGGFTKASWKSGAFECDESDPVEDKRERKGKKPVTGWTPDRDLSFIVYKK